MSSNSVRLEHYWIEAHNDLARDTSGGERPVNAVSSSSTTRQYHRVFAYYVGDVDEFSYRIRFTGVPDEGGVAYAGYTGRKQHLEGDTWDCEIVIRPRMRRRRDVEPERNGLTVPAMDTPRVPSGITCGIELVSRTDRRHEEHEYNPTTARWPLYDEERMTFDMVR